MLVRTGGASWREVTLMVAGVLIMIVGVASILPANRAFRIDPISSLQFG